MARGVNKVILVGNLGADPDVRSTKANSSPLILADLNIRTLFNLNIYLWPVITI